MDNFISRSSKFLDASNDPCRFGKAKFVSIAQEFDENMRESKAQGYFQLDAFVAVRRRSSGSSLSPHESVCTQRACPRARARARTQWTSVKVLPSLSNNSVVPVYPPRVLRLRVAPSRVRHPSRPSIAPSLSSSYVHARSTCQYR